MIEFRTPEISDKNWVRQYVQSTGQMGCEYAFGNIFCWSSTYETLIANVEDFLVTVNGRGYSYPVGIGDLPHVIEMLSQDALERGKKSLNLNCLTQESVNNLQNIMPDHFEFQEYRDGADYIYKQSDLSELVGRKFHSKRNHIAYFEKTFDWKYEQVTPDNINKCAELGDRWYEENKEKDPKGIEREKVTLEKALKNFFDLSFVGGLLYANGTPVAFTIGEQLNENTFCTHFEKADSAVRGAFPMINKLFAENTLNQYEYINREEDTGATGLRKAKLSYHPDILLMKYIAHMSLK